MVEPIQEDEGGLVVDSVEADYSTYDLFDLDAEPREPVVYSVRPTAPAVREQSSGRAPRYFGIGSEPEDLAKRLKKEGMNVLPTQIFDLGDDPLYIGIDPTDLPKSQYLVDRNFE